MADTIEWLETIGKSAKLRHAAVEELSDTLAQTDASDALRAAIMSGDRSQLSTELGNKPMKGEHNINCPGREDEPDHDDGKHSPRKPPKPDKDQPTRDK